MFSFWFVSFRICGCIKIIFSKHISYLRIVRNVKIFRSIYGCIKTMLLCFDRFVISYIL